MIKLSNLISVVLMLMFAGVSNAAVRPALPAATVATPEPVAVVPSASVPESKASNDPKHKDEDFSDELSIEKKGEYQEVVDEYKSYLASVKKPVVDEIRGYRIEIVKINKKKKELYKALSEEAQEYLAKEREMKRKLPVNHRKFSE